MSSRRVAQWRHRDHERAEPKIQVLAERARVDRGAQVAIGRGHHSGVDFDVALRANPPDFALLERSQELRLHGRGNLADFVQEQRAVPCHFEQTRLVSHGTGERAAHVAEELGLQQRFGQGGAVDGYERAARARALVVDQPHDELFPGTTLAVHQDRRVQGGDARRKLEHLLHGGTAGDEVLRGRVTGNALAQQVQLALAFRHVSFAAIEFLEAPMHSFSQALNLLSEIRALKVEAKRLQSVTPALCILSHDRALWRTLSEALGFAEIDLLAETGAHVPAGIAHQRPADGRVALTVVVYVLFGHVGVVPDHVLLESAGGGIVLDFRDVSPHDAFESVKDRTRTEPFQGVRPVGPIAQTHRIVVPVRIPKPQHQTPGRLEPQGIDELLAQQAHGGRAEDDNPLLVEPDDALIRAEIEHLAEIQPLQIDRVGLREPFHIDLWRPFYDSATSIQGPSLPPSAGHVPDNTGSPLDDSRRACRRFEDTSRDYKNR